MESSACYESCASRCSFAKGAHSPVNPSNKCSCCCNATHHVELPSPQARCPAGLTRVGVLQGLTRARKPGFEPCGCTCSPTHKPEKSQFSCHKDGIRPAQVQVTYLGPYALEAGLETMRGWSPSTVGNTPSPPRNLNGFSEKINLP